MNIPHILCTNVLFAQAFVRELWHKYIYKMNIIYLLPEENYVGCTTRERETKRMAAHKYNGKSTEGYEILVFASERKTALYYEMRIQTELGYKGYQNRTPTKANLVRTEKRPINQYKIDGTFIRAWPSARDADRGLGLTLGNVGKVCRGSQHSTGGFIFKFI